MKMSFNPPRLWNILISQRQWSSLSKRQSMDWRVLFICTLWGRQTMSRHLERCLGGQERIGRSRGMRIRLLVHINSVFCQLSSTFIVKCLSTIWMHHHGLSACPGDVLWIHTSSSPSLDQNTAGRWVSQHSCLSLPPHLWNSNSDIIIYACRRIPHLCTRPP